MWRLFAYGGAALWGAGVPLLFYGALRRHRDYVNPPLDASTRERLAAQEWIACYSTFGQARARARGRGTRVWSLVPSLHTPFPLGTSRI